METERIQLEDFKEYKTSECQSGNNLVVNGTTLPWMEIKINIVTV